MRLAGRGSLGAEAGAQGRAQAADGSWECPITLSQATPFKTTRGPRAGDKAALGSECLTLRQSVTPGQPEGTA